MADNKRKSVLYGIAAALLTVTCLFIILWRAGFYPFGPDSLLRIDLETQYADFIVFFKNSTLREKIYSFSKGFGGATTGLVAYYTLSPFNIIVFLLSEYNMELAIFIIITAKFVFMGQGAYWYLNRHFENKAVNLAFMLIYVLYPYFIRFYFNIIWLDCFALLPFLLLMTENVADGKSAKGFVRLYVYALLSNYYITYMLSLFILMYFFWYSFAKNRYDAKHIFRQTVNMAAGVVISAMLAAPVLMPTAFQLLGGKLSGGFGLGRKAPAFNILTVFLSFFDGAHFVDLVPAFTAGVCTVFLFVAFFTSRKAYTAENIGLMAMFAFVSASTYFAKLYYLWHCFAWPEGFVPRFSCVYALLFMTICRKAFDYLDGKGAAKALCILAVIYVACIWFYSWTTHFPWSKSVLGMTAISVTVCTVLYLMMSKREKQAKNLLCVFMVVGILANASMNMNKEKSFRLDPPSPAHTYENEHRIVKQAVEAVSDDGFYRMETLQNVSSNRPLGAGYYGIDHFSSTFDAIHTDMYVHFGGPGGFYGNVYTWSNLVTDSFFGIKYLLSTDANNIPNGYEVAVTGEKNVFYNPYYFPVLFTGDTAQIEYSDDWKQHINNMTVSLTGNRVINENGDTDLTALKSASDILQSNAAEISKQDGGNIELTAKGDYLLTTIIYDDCWQAEVNGQPVQPEKFMEYFIAVPLDGSDISHVTMTYVPKGLSAGIAIMTTALVIIIAGICVKYLRKRGI